MIRVPDEDLPPLPPDTARPMPTEVCPCCQRRILWDPPRVTPAELRIVRAFRDHRAEHGVGATTREIAAALTITQKSVWRHVVDLCDRGLMQREEGKPRSVVVLWDPDEGER